MANQYQRQTALICTLDDLKRGEWVQNEGLEPSGVKCARGMVSRANIIGVVVDKPTEQSFLIEDGTERISARTFDPMPVLEKIEVGNLVQIIGRPREYNNERYVVLESCKALSNSAWIEYRRKELELLSKNRVVDFEQPVVQKPVPEVVPETVEVSVDTKNPFEGIIEAIRGLDSGDGAGVDEIISKVGSEDTEKFINTLIEEGEIFENKPGRVKVLE